MDIKVSLNSGFDTVYLINGKLMEGGEITYGSHEVVYITVLPLSAALLPYTVKLVGGAVKCNVELCDCYNLEPDKYYLKLRPRYNYVYSVNPPPKEPPKDIVDKFFSLIIAQKTSEARELLSKELSDSIDNASLKAFFDGYTDIIPDDRDRGLYFLIDQSGKGHVFNFVVKNNLIDNIIEI